MKLDPLDIYRDHGPTAVLAQVGHTQRHTEPDSVEQLLAELISGMATVVLVFPEGDAERIAEAVAMMEPWGETDIYPRGDGTVMVHGPRAAVQLYRLTEWDLEHRRA